ncbi:hypothetical protein NIES22_47000 [Calothrix brevissima NIES-22]|nr:hypothetical protein NIES22_47000 [Calothrix brevissima NIES-22]
MYSNLPYRQNLVDKFSMYIKVESNNGHLNIQWQSQHHLKRNIELYLSKHQQFAYLFSQQDHARGVVQFWIDMAFHDLPQKQDWEPSDRVQKAWEHLKIYCESSCYEATKQVLKDAYQSQRSECWEEYLFICRCLIYSDTKFRHILAKYISTTSLLDTYITGVLIKTIKDEAGVAKFSKWRLLYKKSDKELKEALLRDGRYEPEISRLLFARKYFKLVYQVNKVQNPVNRVSKKWPEPDSLDFAEAAQYYNAEKLLVCAPHEVAISANTTGEQLQAGMEICITALQNYPKSITPRCSLDALKDAGCEFEALEPSLISVDELEDCTHHQSSLMHQAEAILQQQLQALKPDQQEILLLYYGLRISQQQIANKFHVTQGAIAHRLQTIERKFIKSLYSLKSPPIWVSKYVERWLATNYSAPIYADLIQATLVIAEKKLAPIEREILQLCYAHKLTTQCIAERLDTNPVLVQEILQRTQAKLEAAVIQEIDTLIKKFLQIWLAKISQNSLYLAKLSSGDAIKTKIPLMA